MLTVSPLNILVVEDDPLANQLICRQLELEGHNIAGRAFDGRQAVEMTKELGPDLVLMDLQMQENNTGHTNMEAGAIATQRIQEQCPTPVIILTAHENPTLISKAKAVGAGAYLLKPPKMQEIERAAAIAIARFNDLPEMRHLNEKLQEEIARRKQAEENFKHAATHDALTGLPNRLSLRERAELEIARAKRNQLFLAIMLLDLDHFKTINDTLGHQTGDMLLQTVGERLRQTLRESDTIARLGGDEFLLLLPEIDQVENATETAQRILKAFRTPFSVNDSGISITASLGITFYPDDGDDLETLMKNADIAMYRVKEQGRDNYQYFSRVV